MASVTRLWMPRMYRMYVDETGNNDLAASQNPDHRYLSLTGVIVALDKVQSQFIPGLNKIKTDVFSHDPDKPIIFHRKDMMNKNYPFHALRDSVKLAEFDAKMLRLLEAADYRVVTATIDKQAHLQRYSLWHQDPYHYCLEILVERYVLWMNNNGFQGDVVAETRGKKENERLSKCFDRFYANGTSYVRRDVMQKRITNKMLRLIQKPENVAGLQIADMLAHPSCLFTRARFNNEQFQPNFGTKIWKILEDKKYNRSWWGKLDGFGVKWLP